MLKGIARGMGMAALGVGIFSYQATEAATITGCMANNGNLSIITTGRCPNGLTPLSWNTIGAAGPGQHLYTQKCTLTSSGNCACPASPFDSTSSAVAAQLLSINTNGHTDIEGTAIDACSNTSNIQKSATLQYGKDSYKQQSVDTYYIDQDFVAKSTQDYIHNNVQYGDLLNQLPTCDGLVNHATITLPPTDLPTGACGGTITQATSSVPGGQLNLDITCNSSTDVYLLCYYP